MLKRGIITVAALAMFCLLPLTAWAGDAPIVCTDEAQGISFTVPAGWTELTDLPDEAMKRGFEKDDSENGTYFVYRVDDIYSELDETQKAEFKRSDIDNAFVSIEEFKTLMSQGLTAEQGVQNVVIEPTEISGNHYYQMTFSQTTGQDDTEQVCVYCHIYNGYMIFFRFETYEAALDTADTDGIMNSVDFANELKTNRMETKAKKTVKGIGKNYAYTIVKAILTGLCIVCAFLLRRAKAKRAEKKSNFILNEAQTNVYTPAASQAVTPAENQTPPAENAATPSAETFSENTLPDDE